MEYVKAFFTNNFILLCIAIILGLHCIQRYNEHKRMYNFVFAILGITIILGILVSLQSYVQDSLQNITLTTLLSSLGYIIRPCCVLLFIFLFGQKLNNKWYYLLFLPLLITMIIYLLPFFPNTKEAVFYFAENDLGGISFHGGYTPLRFTSHILSLFYIGYIVYLAIRSLRFKHISHALIIFLSVITIIIAVVIETFDGSGTIQVLNTAIAISTTFYVLYVYAEVNRYDPLTGLFNRSMYYADLPKLEKNITGVIQIDMNGLKYINDTFGHIEGDVSLEIVAQSILKASTSKMFVYRLGGDEFLILAVNESENQIINTMKKIREDLAKTEYSVALGYAYRDDKSILVEDLLKDAEKKMYLDKDAFYKTSTIKRRKIKG